jgi:hypothetical protein
LSGGTRLNIAFQAETWSACGQTISPIVPKGDIPPRKSKREEKIQRAERVWTSPSQDLDLRERCKLNEISIEAVYDKLNTWKIGKEIFGGANDYSAIIKWVIAAVKKDKGEDAGHLDSKALAEKVILKFPIPVSNNHVQLQEKGLLFAYGREYEFIDFKEFGFRDRVLGRLRKMNLSVESL